MGTPPQSEWDSQTFFCLSGPKTERNGLSSVAKRPKGLMALVTLGTVEHKAKAAQVSPATPWRLNPESCECQELPLRLPDASWCHLHSKPRADGLREKKKKNIMGKDGVGATGDTKAGAPRFQSPSLTQVCAPDSLGPGSPANDHNIHSLSLHTTTRLLRSCVPGVRSPQACLLSTGLLCLRGHPTVPHLSFSLGALRPRGTNPMSVLPNHWAISPLSLCGA